MKQFALAFAAGVLLINLTSAGATETGNAPAVTFKQSAERVQANDFLEATITVSAPAAKNPFTDVTVTGQFQHASGKLVSVEGFCDSSDGKTYRIRFLPARPGPCTYSVTLQQDGKTYTHHGQFEAVDGRRRGILRVDREHPWHFVWEGRENTTSGMAIRPFC